MSIDKHYVSNHHNSDEYTNLYLSRLPALSIHIFIAFHLPFPSFIISLYTTFTIFLGRSLGAYLRKIYLFLITLLCMLEMFYCIPFLFIFGNVVLCPAYDGDTNCDNEESMRYLIIIATVMPFAIIYTPVAGIIIFSSSSVKTTYLKVFASMVRVSFVNIILLTSFFLSYVSPDLRLNDKSSDAANFVQDIVLVFQCSHIALLVLTDQYIAFVERIRWTRGWDGLSTSLFVTQDSRKEYDNSQTYGEEDLWIL